MSKKYSFKDLTHAYFLEKSKLYRAGGYRAAMPLTRNVSDYTSHFFAFLIDINVCLLPVYIWVIEFLLIICGLIPPNFFDLLFYIMFALLFVVSVIGLGFFTVYTKGQSFGHVFTDLKIVRMDKREVPPLTLILHQALGVGIPIMVIGYFFKTPGLILWWLANGLCVLITPYQQSIVDLIFHTMTVREPLEEDIQFDPEILPISSKPKPETIPQSVKTTEVCPIDLHILSRYSEDGYYDVEDLFKQAKEAGMEIISITDKNCARANAAAVRFAPLYDIHYIPGVEIDTQYGDIRVRVLGYYIDWNKDIFESIEAESLRREKAISLERVRLFEDYCGIEIDTESLLSKSRFQTITPYDITTMVFNNRRVRELSFVKKYLKEYSDEKIAREHFMKDVFGQQGPCYVPYEYPSVKDMIDAIHDADGIAVLSSWNLDHVSDQEIEEMMQFGFDGIECFSPKLHEETTTALLKIVKAHRLFVTCGSIYRGPNKPKFKLGDTRCPEKALSLVRIMTKAAQ